MAYENSTSDAPFGGAQVAEMMPNSRQTSGTATRASARLTASMIWLSVNLDRFIAEFLFAC